MKKLAAVFLLLGLAGLALGAGYFGVRAAFPRPYLASVEEGTLLAYAVAKAESGFDEDAVSRAGAVGVMQLKPSTAEFICRREGIAYDEDRLFEGEYNFLLGCRYLRYLLERFQNTGTALAAYNAGEGTVRDWLSDPSCSADGVVLRRIPYGETARYVKKVGNFWKFYKFFYR